MEPNTCRTHKTQRTQGQDLEAQPEATCKSLGTQSTVQRTSVHLPFKEVPSPAFHAAPGTLTLAVTGPSIPAVAVEGAVAGVVVAAAAPNAAVGDMWAAVGARGAGTCRGWTHRGGSRSLKASVPGPSSSAGTRTAAHTHTPDTAAATPHSLSAEHAERAERVKYRKASPEALTKSNVQNAKHT